MSEETKAKIKLKRGKPKCPVCGLFISYEASFCKKHRPVTSETKEKNRKIAKEKGINPPHPKGENHPRWLTDRRRWYEKVRRAIYDLLGEKCIRCGFDDKRALQIDHVYGGGNKERKSRGTNNYKLILNKILDGSKEYQILCSNCNWIKRFENNEHK